MKTEIIYEDKDILVCRKPAGLAVENAAVGRMDMVSELKNYLRSPYLGVVHRLDQPVEGLLVFAKNPKSAASLSKQLKNNILNKEYFAVVCGKPMADAGRLVDYLAKDSKTRMAKVVNKGDSYGKEAILTYSTMQNIDNPSISLLKIQIETGRFHQIRAQLNNAGIPIVGDRKYCNGASREISEATGTKNVALCACSLNFMHPVTNEGLSFEIIPDYGVFGMFIKKKHIK